MYRRKPNLAGRVEALSLFKYKAPPLLLINPTRDSLYNNTIWYNDTLGCTNRIVLTSFDCKPLTKLKKKLINKIILVQYKSRQLVLEEVTN